MLERGRPLIVVAAALGLGALALLAAVAPGPTIGVTALAGIAALGWSTRRGWTRWAGPASVAPLLALGIVAFLLGLVALALATATWPVLVALATAVGVTLVLAWRAPAWALAAGILLLCLEGSIKVLLGLDELPVAIGNRPLGAAAIDVALFAAVAGVLIADRLRTPRAIWAGASRAERVVLAVLGAWLALSILQIPQSGDLVKGLEGFRVFQSYVVVGVAAAVVAARTRDIGNVIAVAVGIGFVVSLYAAARVAVGPSEAEEVFVRAIVSTISYGGSLRAVGSFSSSVGMVSFLTPVVVVGLVSGLLMPRLRVLAWATAALALVGVLGSYGRAPLMGIVVGLLFALAVLVAGGGQSRGRKVAAAALVALTVAGTLGGVYAASRGDAKLQERAQGVVDPRADKSVQMRFDTWKKVWGTIDEHPLGQGIGTVGAASSDVRARVVTTDNSYLKVVAEQGIPGVVLFLVGVLGSVALLARRLTRIGGTRHDVGIAALAGFVAFLVLSISGEYVEQPGKAAAWALLGIAAAAALAPPRAAEAE